MPRSQTIPSNNSFSQNYVALCQVHSLPISAEVLTPQLDSESLLVVDVTRLKRDDNWVPVIKTLRRDASLHGFVLFSNQGTRNTDNDQHQLKPMQKIFLPLMGSLRDSLSINHNITKLHIIGITLSNRILKMISTGLGQNKSIKEISFARSGMGDSGLWILSPTLKSKSQSLRSLDLSDCKLTSKGAFIIANVLKSQFVKGQAIKWEQSLRGNIPNSDDDLPRIQRITVNSNTIGDEGIDILMDLLSEEIGLICLDLQDNGITLTGARIAVSVLELNKEIQILDLRNNPCGTNILNDINHHLYRNKLISKELSDLNNITFKDWHWHEGKPLDHTFFKSKASERVRTNTASATARRKAAPATILNKDKSKDSKKRPKSAPMLKSTHLKTPIIVPLSNQRAKIEPSKPCHILKLYKKDNSSHYKKDNSSLLKKEMSLDSLLEENSRLKERLKALETGIVTVSHVLKEEPLPNLPERKDSIESIESLSRENKNTQDTIRKPKKRDKTKKKENLRNLLQTVEASLVHLTQALDKIQVKSSRLKPSSLKDK